MSVTAPAAAARRLWSMPWHRLSMTATPPECQTPAVELNRVPSSPREIERGAAVRPVTDLQRKVAPFEVITEMVPAGDQPAAIAEIEKRIRAGEQDTVLLGATGTGKTATVAWLAERIALPVPAQVPTENPA